MKTTKITKIKVLSILVLVVLSFSSCLKDPRFIDYGSSPALLEFPLASFNANRTILIGPAGPYGISASAGTFTIPVTVNVTGTNPPTTATTFTVTVDNSTLTASGTGTSNVTQVTPATLTTPIPQYFPLPAADYTITGGTGSPLSYSGTVPAGQRTATFNIVLSGTAIGSTVKNYALRLAITSASVQDRKSVV